MKVLLSSSVWVVLIGCFLAGVFVADAFVQQPLSNRRLLTAHFAKKGSKITPNEGESMEEFRKSILGAIKAAEPDSKNLGGREILNLLVNKWGAAYDLQLRKNTPFGEGSGNIYINVMWNYFGQKSFRMSEREYLEHLEAIGRYLTSIKKVEHFKEKIEESRKRPNAYFGYAVGIPLDVDPNTADQFFKDLEYE